MVETRRRGRFPEPGERVPLSFRVTPEFKRKIDQIAAASGKSIAQEMEQRLERSMAAEQHLEDALEMTYGPWLTGLILTIARAMHDTGPHVGFVKSRTPEGSANWHGEPWAYDQAMQAATTILEYFRPEGAIVPADFGPPLEWPCDPEFGPAVDEALRNGIGPGFARHLLRAIVHGVTTGDPPGLELKDWAARRRKQLGVEPDER